MKRTFLCLFVFLVAIELVYRAFARFGSSTIGRTSTVPKRAAGIRLAIEIASLRSVASTKK
jgi:hypothetical protein